MTKKDLFVRNMAKTGKVSADQFVFFLLEYYTAKGYTLDDYEEDLIYYYCYSCGYAKDCKEEAKNCIKNFLKRNKDIVETWEQEVHRRELKD